MWKVELLAYQRGVWGRRIQHIETFLVHLASISPSNWKIIFKERDHSSFGCCLETGVFQQWLYNCFPNRAPQCEERNNWLYVRMEIYRENLPRICLYILYVLSTVHLVSSEDNYRVPSSQSVTPTRRNIASSAARAHPC